MRVDRYDSVESFAQCIKRELGYNPDNNPGFGISSLSWDGGVGFQEALHRSQQGDPSLVANATSMVDRLVDEFTLKEEARPRYGSSIVGSRVSVPDYLCGSPRCMRRKLPSDIQVRSVNLYVNMSSSANIGADVLLTRGTTILALLEYLNLSQVSVELFMVCETDGRTDGDYIQVIRVETHPMDLSVAGFAIAHPAFDRQVCMYMAKLRDGFSGRWPASRDRPNYLELLKKNIGIGDNDIYVPAAGKWDDLLITDPTGWLDQRVQAIRSVVVA